MNILVCISHVPDTTSRISFTEGDTKYDTNGVQFIIGPYDDFALARAVELKESSDVKITVVNVGGIETEPTIRKALAIGADEAIRINAEPLDSYFIAFQLAEVIKNGSYDLILMGRESIDFNSGIIHAMTAELLGMPSVSPVMKLDISGTTATMIQEIEGGHETVTLGLPFVAGCQEPIAEWKIPNMRGIMTARTKPLDVIEPMEVEPATSLLRFELPPPKGDVKMIAEDNVEELVELLSTEAKVL